MRQVLRQATGDMRQAIPFSIPSNPIRIPIPSKIHQISSRGVLGASHPTPLVTLPFSHRLTLPTAACFTAFKSQTY